MKTNRKTMLIAALVVAVVALAGVGYAATGYKATTTVTNNAVSNTEYIFITTDDADYSAAFAGSYAFDTTTSYDSTQSRVEVTYGDCYDVTSGAADPQNPETMIEPKFSYNQNTGFAVDTQSGTYKAIEVGSVQVTIDKSKAPNATEVSLSTSAAGTTVPSVAQPNNVSIVFTKTVQGGTETVIADMTTIDPITLTLATQTNVTFKAYLVAPMEGVALTDAISGSNATMVDVTLTFTATVTA